jgi:hypothetical protein
MSQVSRWSARRDDIVHLLKNGMSIAELAETYGVKPKHMRRVLLRMHIDACWLRNKYWANVRNLRALMESGYSRTQIAHLYHVDENLVEKYLKFHDLDPRDPVTRFKAKLAVRENGCIEWTGYVEKASGYGVFTYKTGTRDYFYAHRFSFVLQRGDIPAGMTLDHTCVNKRCVNPDHLEVVTASENSKRMHARRNMLCEIAKRLLQSEYPFVDRIALLDPLTPGGS